MSNWYRPAAQSRLQELPSGSKAGGGHWSTCYWSLAASEAALGEYCGKTPIYRVEEPSHSELARLGLEAREDPSSDLHHHMNHVMQASLLAEGICALAHVLLADVGPHAATATCEIFHVWR